MFSFIKKMGFIAIIVTGTMLLCHGIYAENLSVSFEYGINNVGRANCAIPISVNIENRDATNFDGRVDFCIYENSESVFRYSDKVNVLGTESTKVPFISSFSSGINTVIINIYNTRDEMVFTDRYNVDFSQFDNKLIIGVFSDVYDNYAYLDNMQLDSGGIEIKLAKITYERLKEMPKLLETIDVLFIEEKNNEIYDDALQDELEKFVKEHKMIVMHGVNGRSDYESFLQRYLISSYRKANFIEILGTSALVQVVDDNESNMIFLPDEFASSSSRFDNYNYFRQLFSTQYFVRFLRLFFKDGKYVEHSNFSDINYLIDAIDSKRLPDIFLMTVFSFAYIAILTIAIYSILRSLNKRRMFDKIVFICSILSTAIVLIMCVRTLKNDVVLSYMSIVDLDENSVEENAYLNFRTNDSSSYNLSINATDTIVPLFQSSSEPVTIITDTDRNTNKEVTITRGNSYTNVFVNNPNTFDSNLFLYKSSMGGDSKYNIVCHYERFEGKITGRVTNNMSSTIHDAAILFYDKIVKIGDIEPNYSFSLARAESLRAPIGDNRAVAEIVTDDENYNLLNSYLYSNLAGYFDYGIFIGFIDDNKSIDIGSNNVGDKFGKTLITMKVVDSKAAGIYDISSLSKDVITLEGEYDAFTNSILSEGDVINVYSFDENLFISELYFDNISESISNSIDSDVPFYGDISIYNTATKTYDLLSDTKVYYDELSNYLSNDNKVIVKYSDREMDPLYRQISLPVLRAIASE